MLGPTVAVLISTVSLQQWKTSYLKNLTMPLLLSLVQSNMSGYRFLKYAASLSVAKKASLGDEGTRRNLSPNKYEDIQWADVSNTYPVFVVNWLYHNVNDMKDDAAGMPTKDPLTAKSLRRMFFAGTRPRYRDELNC
jgi:hypothetical protein